MEELKKKILKSDHILEKKIIKVDSFLNHQIDVKFLNDIGKEFKQRFKNQKIDKILTIEASGIAIAAITAQYFENSKVVFAKKTLSANLDSNFYMEKVFSYTKNTEYDIMVSKNYISEGENILVLDDFLANGKASLALCNIVKKAGANLIGVGIVVEKSFQEGREILEKNGIRVESLARIKLVDGDIDFI